MTWCSTHSVHADAVVGPPALEGLVATGPIPAVPSGVAVAVASPEGPVLSRPAGPSPARMEGHRCMPLSLLFEVPC